MADIKLKDLRYLVAVADTGHFGHAAERCFVSQPTLSAQLKKLEDYLGVPLVERQPRKALLTPAGAEIVARARRIVDASDEVVAIAQAHREPLAGRLKIAFLPTIGPYLLPVVAPRLRKALPQLELMLYEYQTATMLERLRAGDIDMGILALPVDLDGLASRPLYDEPFVVAAPAGHCLRDQALDVCNRIDVHEKQDFRATSIETLRQMVASGAGVTLMPEFATRGSHAAPKGLVFKPFSKPAPTRSIGAIWRKSSPRTVAIDAIARVIADHAE
jgi:LysR family hydrogen peroxide-inducible transcriptional activator